MSAWKEFWPVPPLWFGAVMFPFMAQCLHHYFLLLLSTESLQEIGGGEPYLVVVRVYSWLYT